MATTASGVTAAHELDELYRLHAAEVFRYAYAVLGNRADAEDVTQTTFVNALRALERGEKPRKPTNWLITIAHNLIRQRFRQQQTRPLEVELDRDVAVEEDVDEGPSIDELVRALQRIPPTQRQALVLRELEGRSYGEIGELLGVSQSALEALIFRARRSLAEELENLVTCDRAEIALSRETDGRLGRKERRRLVAHIDECTSCARMAARSLKHRRAFKALAVLPLPFTLTFFKGAPSAAAATGLPTIGAAGTAAGTAAGIGAAGITTKIAVGLAAVAVAGGAGYEGVKAVQAQPAAPERTAAKVERAAATPARRLPVLAATATASRVARTTPVVVKKTKRPKPPQAATPERGKSAAAPGHNKTETKTHPTKASPPAANKPATIPKPKTSRDTGPAAKPTTRGKSTVAPAVRKPKPKKIVAKPDPVEKTVTPAAAKETPKPEKPDTAEAPLLKPANPRSTP
ncbi:MAG TPA: sigma-70 family RNA polymerase sigma factor [Gaiellaceae bacterium]|nr:sigma-70 family RNA polymerase sigma factor [Gaiellaceae bacterium]